MRFFIDISYDGTNYHGWQIQPNAKTIQDQINKAISTILNQEINVVGAGRTDTGVHAKQLIAHFDYDKKIDTKKIVHKLNGFLDEDISINEIYRVKSDAHARFSAISRTYTYSISKTKDPFSKYSLLINRELNLEQMSKACNYILGEKDYSAFAKLHSDSFTNNCNIYNASWQFNEKSLIFSIRANRFLRNMVRAIVGTMLEVGDGKLKANEIDKIILSKDRSKAGFSVPARGLSLIQVDYPKEIKYEGK